MWKRAARRFVAWLGLGAFLFAQMAIAAYVCPQIEAALAGTAMVVPCGQMSMVDRPADAMPCKSHCTSEHQAVGTPAAVDLPTPVPLRVAYDGTALAWQTMGVGPVDLRLAGPPRIPVFASSGRLRI